MCYKTNKKRQEKQKYGCHIGMTQSLHSTFVPNPTSHTRTIWARTSKLYLSAMPSIYVKDGSTQKVVWQSSRWQEFTVKK